jgi:hypothetical protein
MNAIDWNMQKNKKGGMLVSLFFFLGFFSGRRKNLFRFFLKFFLAKKNVVPKKKHVLAGLDYIYTKSNNKCI